MQVFDFKMRSENTQNIYAHLYVCGVEEGVGAEGHCACVRACVCACVRAQNCCWWASAGLLRLEESYVQLWFPSTHSWTLTHSLSGAAHSTPQGCDLQPADTNGCLTSAYHNTAACRIMGRLNLKPRGAEQTLTSVAPSCWPYGKQRMIYNTVRQYASRFHHAKLITG